MESVAIPDLTEAFPEDLRSRVRAVLDTTLQSGLSSSRSPDDIGVLTLNGQQLRIPARIYEQEPDWSRVQSLGLTEQLIVACVFTRHHDGHVRERALARVHAVHESWVAPFIIQLLGEYVIEVIERAASLIQGPVNPAFAIFVQENPRFLELTTARATSYWNEYYRRRFRRREEYPAFPALTTLLKWRSSETAA
jgi:hypothetical protein